MRADRALATLDKLTWQGRQAGHADDEYLAEFCPWQMHYVSLIEFQNAKCNYFLALTVRCPLDVETAEINFYIRNPVFVFRSSCNFPLFFFINNSELVFCDFVGFPILWSHLMHIFICFYRIPLLAFVTVARCRNQPSDVCTGRPIRMHSRFGFPRKLRKYVFVWLADFS